MSFLHRAIELAVKAHARQDDPPGEPYILHPMRVMLSLPAHDHDLRCVAILHDSVERGKLTLKRLAREKFSPQIIRALRLLTHDKKTSYADYVIALKRDRLARAVKLADLTDNAALSEVPMRMGKAGKDMHRVVRYALSYKFLTGELSRRDYRKLMRPLEK